MANNYFQDDERENAMIELFGLYKADDEGRSGIDAFLEIDGKNLPFELKTTSTGSVTTVRDFGPDHIKKWKNKHWLIGSFIRDREFYLYGSPEKMATWIEEKENYISTDFKLADLIPQKISLSDMFEIIGKKEKYSIENAKSIQKKQYKIAEYIQMQDMENGYSPERMLRILQDRANYLIQRGSTLNNPHIPYSYFDGWTEITHNHKNKLREMVQEYLNSIN